MTTRPRLWFVLFSTLVFLIGAVTGLLLSRFIESPVFAGPDVRPPFIGRGDRPPMAIADRMTKDLQLSEAQRQQLVQLFEERRSRLAEFHQNVRSQFDREHDTLRSGIQRILTPQQFERFENEIRKRAPRRPPPPLE
jgi:hypothetical protein